MATTIKRRILRIETDNLENLANPQIGFEISKSDDDLMSYFDGGYGGKGSDDKIYRFAKFMERNYFKSVYMTDTNSAITLSHRDAIESPSKPDMFKGVGGFNIPIMHGYRSINIGVGAGIVSGSVVTGDEGPGYRSVNIGDGAGLQSTSTHSVAIGYESGRNSTGSLGVTIGYEASLNGNYDRSIVMGRFANKNGSMHESVAIGNGAGVNSSVSKSILIGRLVGGDSKGTHLIYMGEFSGAATNSSNYKNIGIGYSSLFTSHIAREIVALGSGSGCVGGDTNAGVMIGLNSGVGSKGDDNIALGTSSGNYVDGDNNIAIGEDSLAQCVGDENISIGKGSGFYTSGKNNIFIGSYAGENMYEASNNILLGRRMGTTNAVKPPQSLGWGGNGGYIKALNDDYYNGKFMVGYQETDNSQPFRLLWGDIPAGRLNVAKTLNLTPLNNPEFDISLANKGDIVYDNAANVPKYFDGSSWKSFGGGGSGSGLPVGYGNNSILYYDNINSTWKSSQSQVANLGDVLMIKQVGNNTAPKWDTLPIPTLSQVISAGDNANGQWIGGLRGISVDNDSNDVFTLETTNGGSTTSKYHAGNGGISITELNEFKVLPKTGGRAYIEKLETSNTSFANNSFKVPNYYSLQNQGIFSGTTGIPVYNSSTKTYSNITNGSNGQVLTMVSGTPQWSNASGGGGAQNLAQVLSLGEDGDYLGMINLGKIDSGHLQTDRDGVWQITAPVVDTQTDVVEFSGFAVRTECNGIYEYVDEYRNYIEDGGVRKKYPFYAHTNNESPLNSPNNLYLIRWGWYWLVVRGDHLYDANNQLNEPPATGPINMSIMPKWHNAAAYGAGGSINPAGDYNGIVEYGEPGDTHIVAVYKEAGAIEHKNTYSLKAEGGIHAGDTIYAKHGVNVNNLMYLSSGELGYTGYTRIILNDHHEDEEDFACTIAVAGTDVIKFHENGTADLPNRRMDTLYFDDEILIMEKIRDMGLEDLSLKNITFDKDWSDPVNWKEDPLNPGQYIPDVDIEKPWSDGSIAFVNRDMSPGGTGEQYWDEVPIGNTGQVLSIKMVGMNKVPYWKDTNNQIFLSKTVAVVGGVNVVWTTSDINTALGGKTMWGYRIMVVRPESYEMVNASTQHSEPVGLFSSVYVTQVGTEWGGISGMLLYCANGTNAGTYTVRLVMDVS